MNIQKKIFTGSFSAIAIAALFAACSTATLPDFPDDCEYSVNSQACLESEGLIASTDKDETNEQPSGTVSSDSKDNTESSSSNKNPTETSSSSDSGNGSANSSSSNPDSGTAESSSSDSENGSVSSSSSNPGSSSITESSSSEKPAESSSSAVFGQSTIMVDDNTASVGTENMEKVSASEATELNSWKEAIEQGETVDGFELSDKLNFGYTDMDFENNIYYCFTGDNEWLRIPFDNLKESGLPFLWNGAAWGLQRKYSLRFEDACSAIYVQRKSST